MGGIVKSWKPGKGKVIGKLRQGLVRYDVSMAEKRGLPGTCTRTGRKVRQLQVVGAPTSSASLQSSDFGADRGKAEEGSPSKRG